MRVLPGLLVLGLLGCRPATTEDSTENLSVQRDVLLVTIDTLRPDVVSAYGHPRPTTPNLDAIGEAGVLFERAYTTTPMTAAAHASMLTGLFPAEHGLLRNGQVLDPALPRLSTVLSEAGYRTAAFLGAHVLDDRFAFDVGFEEFDADMGGARRHERPAEEVVASAIEWIETVREGPRFLWVHVYDPHRPFESRPPEEGWVRESFPIMEERVEPSEKYARGKLIREWLEYEFEVVRTDAALGELLDAWNASAGGADSVVAALSDHGEGMGEHDYLDHGRFLWEEQVRVPWMLRAPGISAGLRVDTPVSLVDLASTLLELAMPAAAGALAGDSLVDAMLEERAAPGVVHVERPHIPHPWAEDLAKRETQRLVDRDGGASVDGPVKYIWIEEEGPLLFDLESDGAEAEDLASSSPELLTERAEEYELWQASLEAHGRTVEQRDPATEEMLEALGYQ
jgi:choline-sulfatase